MMTIDAGIDWDASYGAGWIARFSASPVFEAGSALLHGAAQLWKGRYGAGRIVGKEALALASIMNDLGAHWRQAALKRTPDVFPPGTFSHEASQLLASCMRRREYYLHDAASITKHPMAARRLGRTAVLAAHAKIEVFRVSGRAVCDYGGTDAIRWEDRFESFGETSLGIPPEDDVSELAQGAYARYAVHRICHSLWASASHAAGLRGGTTDTDPLVKACSEESDRFGEFERAAYERFATLATKDVEERVAILSVMDRSYGSISRCDGYASEKTVNDLVSLVSFYTDVLLRSVDDAGAQTAWSRQRFEGLGALTLPEGGKKLRKRTS